MKLTKTVIDKLPTPTDGYALYRDDELPGFGVRVTHAGVKSFFLEKRIHRKVKRLTLGRYGVLTAEQARREAVKLLGRIATGETPSRIEPKRGWSLSPWGKRSMPISRLAGHLSPSLSRICTMP